MIVAGIPAYNEEKTIAGVILTAQRHVDMVIVADDGSTDLTGEIAHRLGAVVIHHDRNMGYGAAIKTLFKKAKDMNADVLVTLDSDGQHDPNEIPRMIQPILEDRADIVVGSRFLLEANGGLRFGVPAYRRWGIKLLTRLSNGSGINGHLSDGQSGFRAYNRKAVNNLKLHEEGMGISAEILMKAGQQGLRVSEVPAVMNYHDLDTSTHHPLRHGFSVVATILKLVVEERPLFFLGIPGTVSFLVGVVLGLLTLQLYTVDHVFQGGLVLASFAFAIIGIFALFTAITLYAIVRLDQKQRLEH